MQSEPPGAETHEPVFPTKQRSLCLRCDDTGRPVIVNGDRRLTRAADVEFACRRVLHVQVKSAPTKSAIETFAAAGDR
jgi:hypothetical protein